jgi:cytochrome c oxidase assembly protein subunit 11
MTIEADKSKVADRATPEGAGDARTAVPSNRRVAVISASVAVFMLGMAYAAVPLYQMFCQVTGFAGTTQRAEKAPDQSEVLDQTITVRFDSNVAHGLTWKFKPVQNTLDVKYGENRLAFYTATNTSDKPVTGTASFNVAPEAAGAYFNKIECFCFTEQTLQPGETVEMPVSFFVDPEMVKDRSARSIKQVTLSYTFFPVTEEKRADVSVGKNSVTQ